MSEGARTRATTCAGRGIHLPSHGGGHVGRVWAVEAVDATLRLGASKVVIRRFRCRLRGVREW